MYNICDTQNKTLPLEYVTANSAQSSVAFRIFILIMAEMYSNELVWYSCKHPFLIRFRLNSQRFRDDVQAEVFYFKCYTEST